MPGQRSIPPMPFVADVDRLDSAQISMMLNNPEVRRLKALGRVSFRRVGYLRISKDRGNGGSGDGLGVQRQYTDICRKWPDDPCEYWYVDNDTSAFSGVDRSGYLEMLADITKGVIVGDGEVRAAHADRLHRDTAQANEFMLTCFDYRQRRHNRDVIFNTVMSGRMDFHTADGRKQFRDINANAQWYSEIISEKVILKWNQKQEAGEPINGKRRFGFDTGLVINEREAKAIREGAEMVLASKSLSEVARAWNAAGLTTPYGAKIRVETVSKALRRPATTGLGVRADGSTYEGNWKPILDRETWTKVQARLADPRRKGFDGGFKPRWLGTGLYLCGVCGSTMVVRGQAYRCRSMTTFTNVTGERRDKKVWHASRVAEWFDTQIEELLLARLLSEDLADAIAERNTAPATDLGETRQHKAELEEQISVYRSLVGQPGWGPVEIAEAVSKLTVQLDEVNASLSVRQVAPLTSQMLTEGLVEKKWAGATIEQKRAVLSELVTITLQPSRGRAGGGFNSRERFRDFIDLDWHV